MTKLVVVDQSPNSPDVVRKSFLEYLRREFPYKKDWKHPSSGHVFKHEEIKSVLKDYMKMDSKSYRVLWYLWTTQGTRAFVAEMVNFSSPTVKRMWNRSINTLMLMLLFPELQPESFVLFNGGYSDE